MRKLIPPKIAAALFICAASAIAMAVSVCHNRPCTGARPGLERATLAPELRTPERRFTETAILKMAELAHPAVNGYIKRQIDLGIGQYGGKQKWLDAMTEPLDLTIPENICGNVKTCPSDLKKVLLIKIPGLFKHTRQFGHAGLSGKDYDGIPVMYVDSYYYDKCGRALVRHELDEILSWRHLASDILGLKPDKMRSWIREHIDQADTGLDGMNELRVKNAREIAKHFHDISWPLDDLYSLAAVSEPSAPDMEYLYRLSAEFSGGEDDINISSGDLPGWKSADTLLSKLPAPVIGNKPDAFRTIFSLSPEITALCHELLDRIHLTEGKKLPPEETMQKSLAADSVKIRLNRLLIEKGYLVDLYSYPAENGLKNILYVHEIVVRRVIRILDQEFNILHLRTLAKTHPEEDRRPFALGSYDYAQHIIKLIEGDIIESTEKIFSVLGGAEYRSDYQYRNTAVGREVDRISAAFIRSYWAGHSVKDIFEILIAFIELHEIKHRIDDVSGLITRIVNALGLPENSNTRTVIMETSAYLAGAAYGPASKYQLFFLALEYIYDLDQNRQSAYSLAADFIFPRLFPDITSRCQANKATKETWLLEIMRYLADADEKNLNDLARALYRRQFALKLTDLPEPVETDIIIPHPHNRTGGNPASCLQTIVRHPELMDAALNGKGSLMSDLIKARSLDDSIKRSSVYKEIAVLRDTGVIIRAPGYNRLRNPAYIFSPGLGQDKNSVIRFIERLRGLEYPIGRSLLPFERADIPSHEVMRYNERMFVRQLTSELMDMNSIFSLADSIEDQSDVNFVITYDRARLQEYARKAGLDKDGVVTPENILQEYRRLLSRYLGDDRRVKLVGMHNGGGFDKELVSVTAYHGPDRSPSSRIGASNIYVLRDLSGQPLRLAGMLNLAVAASLVPDGTADNGNDPRIVFIRAQYRSLTGADIPDGETEKTIRSIVLPDAQPIPLEKMDTYYRICLRELLRSA